MTAEPHSTTFDPEPDLSRRNRSERLLATLSPFRRVVTVSHVNPDPDSLASMLGIKALIEAAQPGKSVTLTFDGMIARSENRAMVELIPIPLVPVGVGERRRGDGRGDGRHPALHRPPVQRGGHAPGRHRPP